MVHPASICCVILSVARPWIFGRAESKNPYGSTEFSLGFLELIGGPSIARPATAGRSAQDDKIEEFSEPAQVREADAIV